MSKIVIYIARGLSLILTVLMLMFLFGEGLPDLSGLGATTIILYSLFTIIIIGLILGWWYDKIAGYLIIGSSLSFWIVMCINSGKFWIHWFLLIYFIIGVLFILATQFDKPPKRKSKK